MVAKKKSQTIITPHEMRELRSQAHLLKPVVIIGNKGLSDAVLQEIDIALRDHELIKVRVNIDDREQLSEIIAKICEKTGSSHIQSIGYIITIYRKNPGEEES